LTLSLISRKDGFSAHKTYSRYAGDYYAIYELANHRKEYVLGKEGRGGVKNSRRKSYEKKLPYVLRPVWAQKRKTSGPPSVRTQKKTILDTDYGAGRGVAGKQREYNGY